MCSGRTYRPGNLSFHPLLQTTLKRNIIGYNVFNLSHILRVNRAFHYFSCTSGLTFVIGSYFQERVNLKLPFKGCPWPCGSFMKGREMAKATRAQKWFLFPKIYVYSHPHCNEVRQIIDVLASFRFFLLASLFLWPYISADCSDDRVPYITPSF